MAAEARRFVNKTHSVQSTSEWTLKGNVPQGKVWQADTSADLQTYMTKAGVPAQFPASDDSGSE